MLRNDDWVEGVAWSPDGRRVVTGSGNRIARVWDAKIGRVGGIART
jgi:WD40 repeat protein